jgi:serine/threonine protein kinase
MGVRPFTPAYASPEQMLGSTAREAADVYSLGRILYELVTGRRAFGDVHNMKFEDLREMVLKGPPEAPSAVLANHGMRKNRSGYARSTQAV